MEEKKNTKKKKIQIQSNSLSYTGSNFTCTSKTRYTLTETIAERKECKLRNYIENINSSFLAFLVDNALLIMFTFCCHQLWLIFINSLLSLQKIMFEELLFSHYAFVIYTV